MGWALLLLLLVVVLPDIHHLGSETTRAVKAAVSGPRAYP
jgi:hypothetical protein